MDDLDDEFLPISITGVSKAGMKYGSCSQTSANNRLSKTMRRENRDNVSCSQLSSVSRLSKSFRKINKNNSYAHSLIGSTVTPNNLKPSTSTTSLHFCPTCQAPFDIVRVSPNVHAYQCTVDWTELEECPDGELCYNESIFHYRDYAHSSLAKIRASKGHLDTAPKITPAKGSRSKNKINDSFKLPLCKFSSDNVYNCKKKLFSDSDSIITLSTDSNKDLSIKTSKNKVNNFRTINGEIKSNDLSHTLVNEETEKSSELLSKRNLIFYGPEISNKISVNKNKHLRNESEINESKQSSSFSNYSEFRMPNKKRKIENNITSTSDTNFQNQNFTSSLNSKEASVLSSQKMYKDFTVLDTLSNFEVEHCIEKEKYADLCDNNSEREHNLVKECKNCNTHELPCNEEEHLASEQRKEVRATLSVVVSPTGVDFYDVQNEPETPVKVDASCDKSGWKTIEIAAPTTTQVDNVKLAVCNCAKTMEVNCSLSQNHTVLDIADNVESSNKELEVKFFSHVKEPKQFNKLNANETPPKHINHQMSITSYFKTSRQPSTLSLKSSIIPISTETRTQDNYCVNNDIHEVTTTSPELKQDKEPAVNSWKHLLKRMVLQGKSTLSVMSDDSIAMTESQTSAGSCKPNYTSKKTCPFYKKIPDTTFVVDAFQYGVIPRVTHYFLSHFHYDHYGGLKKSFSHPLYCSKITAALVKMKIGVNERYIHELELDTPSNICGVLVTALDANHCPGSVMFLFQLRDGRNFLHVGDFRADPKMESYPCFWNLTIHKLFLDTTYCEPKYDFPMQSETISRVVDLAMEHYGRNPSTLFVCGTYTIGKEKVFIAIAEAVNCKIWAHPDKRRVLKCIDNPDINERLISKQLEAQVHVCRMHDLNNTFLQSYLKQHKGVFTHVVAFIPTGWEMKPGRNKASDSINVTSYGNVTTYGVPYSEHSSFTELKRFVQFLKPGEVIPTVNVGNPTKRTIMKKYFSQWLSEDTAYPTANKKQIQQTMGHYIQLSKQKK